MADIPLFMLGLAATLVLVAFCLLVIWTMLLYAIEIWRAWQSKP